MNVGQLLDGLEFVCEVTEPSDPQYRDYSYLSQYFWGKPDFGSYVPHTFVFYIPYTNDDVPVYLFYRRSTNSKHVTWRQYRINRELSDSLRTRLHQVCSYHFSEELQ